jgi:hypothetical protein
MVASPQVNSPIAGSLTLKNPNLFLYHPLDNFIFFSCKPQAAVMSLRQVESCFRSRPLASSTTEPKPPFVYFFLYDEYFDCRAFESRFPEAKNIGLGSLKGWVWHINVNGICSLLTELYTRLTDRSRETKYSEDVLQW